jgi:hypothetical protein
VVVVGAAHDLDTSVAVEVENRLPQQGALRADLLGRARTARRLLSSDGQTVPDHAQRRVARVHPDREIRRRTEGTAFVAAE